MPLQWDATGTVSTPGLSNVIAAQVLDWMEAENIDDVSMPGDGPNVIQLEVFSALYS